VGSFWFLLVGVLLVAVALLGRFLDRLPVSLAMIYLVVGFVLGPAVANALELHPMRQLGLLESITELALLIAAIAAAGYWLLGLSVGMALLLGAILSPTDPVLASDVQLRSAHDRDTLRFALTGEGGLNDGTAFPFVLLGLGLLGLHDIGPFGLRWLAVDVVWGVVGGLGIGFLVGMAVARVVRRLRAWRRDAVLFDEFLLLGVIGLSYGAALAAHTLGFLAVFAAGLALRRADDIHASSQQATDKPPLTPSMLNVNEQLERIVEVAIVLLVGAMISTGYWSMQGLWIAALLIFVVRPLSVWIGLMFHFGGDPVGRAPRRLLAWFGIRGIGSVYYAVYVAGHDIRYGEASALISCVFTVIAASIVVHGISAAPLMELYQRRRSQPRGSRAALSDKR
jgi:NhaP-type Na+/H+ or K+/H+ antiporter